MEKSRSFPDHRYYYSSSSSSGGGGGGGGEGGFGYENRSNSYSFNGPSGKGDGGFASSSDPELKRKRRVASYNSFAVERKLKSSVRSSFKWIKSKFTDAVYGI